MDKGASAPRPLHCNGQLAEGHTVLGIESSISKLDDRTKTIINKPGQNQIKMYVKIDSMELINSEFTRNSKRQS